MGNVLKTMLLSSAMFILCLSGCSSEFSSPMATSLTALTAEVSVKKTHLGDYHEIVSLDGRLMMPEVGAVYYYPDPEVSVWGNLGIFLDIILGKTKFPSPPHIIATNNAEPNESYVLTLKTTGRTPSAKAVKDAVEDLQAKTAKSIRLTVSMAAIDAQLADSNLPSALTTSLQEERKALLDARTENDKKIDKANKTFRDSLDQNVIVARWTAAREAGGALDIDGIIGGKGKSSRTISGFLIMGGYKVSMLYFGHDYEKFITKIKKSSGKQFKDAGIITFLLQTEDLAYTTDLNIEQYLEAHADIDLKELDKVFTQSTRLKIRAYMSQVASLSNSGALKSTQWVLKDRIFASAENGSEEKLSDNPETPDDVAPVGSDVEIHSKANSSPSLATVGVNGKPASELQWKTVYAIMIKAEHLHKMIHKEYEEREEHRGKAHKSPKGKG